jgi:flagellar hook assembly protein FlgD
VRNYPNPFNPATTIAFEVPVAGRVHLAVYDARGALVRTLVDGALPAGPWREQWDGRDQRGRAVASGVYFVRLAAGGTTASHKVTLLK